MASHELRGQPVSGDLHVVEAFEGGFLVAAIDGLGHGPHAAAAAQIAADIVRAHARDPVAQLLNRCHAALTQTRGAAISLASFDKRLKSLWWLGVGNVEGAHLRLDENARLATAAIPLSGGVVGYQLPPLRPAHIWLQPRDLIVFATDGIQSRFIDGLSVLNLGVNPQHLADQLLAEYDKGSDDSLVLVVRYLGGES